MPVKKFGILRNTKSCFEQNEAEAMKRSVKLTLRLSEIRQRLNTLLAIEDRSDDQAGEMESLTAESQKLEPELRASLVAEGDAEQRAAENFAGNQNPEDRELRSLIAGSTLAEVIGAVVERRAATGRTAEYQQHLGLGPSQVPLELLRDRGAEIRQVTPIPSDTEATQQEILQPVFATGDLAFLAIQQQTVPAGQSVHPVLTTRPTVKTHADSTTVAETTGAFSATALSPERTQASFFFRRADNMQFPGMEEALRMALSSALSEQLDALWMAQMIKAANAGGLGNATDLASAEAGFGDYKRLVAGNVEGRFSASKQDIRSMMGAATFAHADTQYTSNGDVSALSSISAESGGVRVSPHVAAVASKKQDAFVRLGMRADGVVALWNGVHLIYDEISKASSGEIQLTALLMNSRAILRTGAFKRIAVQVEK